MTDELRGPKGMYIKHLAAWRVHRFLSQQQLAERAGLQAATVAAYERGRLRASFPAIQRLAAALELTPDQLVYEAPPKREAPDPHEEMARLFS